MHVRLLIRISISLFGFVCPFQCPNMLWLIVCAYTSVDRVYFSLSLSIFVLVFGYIVIHCTCICTSLGPCFSVSSFWMPLSVFGYIVIDCPCIVSSLDPHIYLCFSFSVSVSAYITANSVCICTSIYLCFPLMFCLWMCIPVSEYIIIHSWCICTSLDPCFYLSHFLSCLCLCSAILSLIVRI